MIADAKYVTIAVKLLTRHFGPDAATQVNLFNLLVSRTARALQKASIKFEFSPRILPKAEMQPGCYYRGGHRCTTIAMWDGSQFLYFNFSMGTYSLDKTHHVEDQVSNIDTFAPVEKLESNLTDEECSLIGKTKG